MNFIELNKLVSVICIGFLIMACNHSTPIKNPMTKQEVSKYFDEQKEKIFKKYNTEILSKTTSYTMVTYIYSIDKYNFNYDDVKKELINNHWYYKKTIKSGDLYCDNNSNALSIVQPAVKKEEIIGGYIAVQSVGTWNVAFLYHENGWDECKT